MNVRTVGLVCLASFAGEFGACADEGTAPSTVTSQAGHIDIDLNKVARSTIIKVVPLEIENYTDLVRRRAQVTVANIALSNDLRLHAVESPSDAFAGFGSSVVLTYPKERKVYPIARIYKDDSLSLRYVSALVTRRGEKIVILSYFGQPSASSQGFVIARQNGRSLIISTLPSTRYGKVIVSDQSLDMISLWSADPREIEGPMTKVHYLVQHCKWTSLGYKCGSRSREGSTMSPNSVIYPGVEVRHGPQT